MLQITVKYFNFQITVV